MGNSLTIDGTQRVPLSTYSALTRMQDGTWIPHDTQLPIVQPGGRMVFLDVNGDGLPDAVQSGWMDHVLRTYYNTGGTFGTVPLNALPPDPLGEVLQDQFFNLATPLDYNGDGRQDLLIPLAAGTNVAPAWAILQAQEAGANGPTFTRVDPKIPFEPLLGSTGITLADPHGPRVGDVDGDGAEDVILPLSGVFNVFQNLAPDQDLLVTVTDGMNAHDPTDPGFTPNVSVSYGHLTDAAITGGTALSSYLYLSHADATNDCGYPRSCAVGPRRVVSAYATNNGADSLRHYGVRYRDGRYHRLGRGFLGFEERLVTDLDTLAGTADFTDNVTFTAGLNVFPYAGQVLHAWRWYPGNANQADSDQIELSFTDVTPGIFFTNGATTYFTIPMAREVRREEGDYPDGTAPTMETYVEQIASTSGATLLSDTTLTVAKVDPTFGNVLSANIKTSGVDLTMDVRAHVLERRHDQLGHRSAPDRDRLQLGGGALAVPSHHASHDDLRRGPRRVHRQRRRPPGHADHGHLLPRRLRQHHGDHRERCVRALADVHRDVTIPPMGSFPPSW